MCSRFENRQMSHVLLVCAVEPYQRAVLVNLSTCLAVYFNLDVII